MMKGYRQKRRYFALTRCRYLHFFPNKWYPRFGPHFLIRPIFTSRRSAEPLASIWLPPCTVLLDPKEKCGFKIQVRRPCSVARYAALLTSTQVQTVKGSRKKVFDDSELVLQCESEAERDDWMALIMDRIRGVAC